MKERLLRGLAWLVVAVYIGVFYQTLVARAERWHRAKALLERVETPMPDC